MKILVVSNLYPPYHVGGYELACQNLVEKLKQRGHEVKVLTSSYGLNRPKTEGDVLRWLAGSFVFDSPGDSSRRKMLQKELAALIAFWKLKLDFNPDVVYIWNLAYIPVSLATLAHHMGYPTCYYVFDNWLSRWESDPWRTLWLRSPNRSPSRIGKKILHLGMSLAGLDWNVSLNLQDVHFASRYLRGHFSRAGKRAARARLISWGVELGHFPFKDTIHSPKRLLFVGQLVPHKGVHTAIEAVALLVHHHKLASISLSIVGGSVNPEYVAHLKKLVKQNHLEDKIQFYGPCSSEQMPGVYREHDILLFPSSWDEPFGMVLLEAMASGLVVVGTARGGSADILQNEVNALVFPKEDVGACARQVVRLLNDSERFERIRQNGRRTVEERFRLESTVDQIESALQEVVVRHESTLMLNNDEKHETVKTEAEWDRESGYST